MENYKGVLEFEYYGQLKKIPYSIYRYAGDIHISITDKRGYSHGFYTSDRSGGWRPNINCWPKWPKDFMVALFKMFDLARERHGL